MSPDMSNTTALLLGVVVVCAFLTPTLTTTARRVQVLLTHTKGDA